MSDVDLTTPLFDESYLEDLTRVLGHPDEVLRHPALTMDEKRQILADWASDAHAVPDAPSLRQVQSGAVVALDDVLHSLRMLDGPEAHRRPRVIRTTDTRRRRHAVPRVHALWRKRDDDDDPPPTPAAAMPFELALARSRKWEWESEHVAA